GDVVVTAWVIGTEAVLAIVRQAVVGDHVAGPDHDAGTGIGGDGVVVDGPVDPAVAIDHSLVERGKEVLNREVGDGDAGGALGESEIVDVLPAQDRAGGTDERGVGGRGDRVVTGVAQCVGTGGEIEGGTRSVPVDRA